MAPPRTRCLKRSRKELLASKAKNKAQKKKEKKALSRSQKDRNNQFKQKFDRTAWESKWTIPSQCSSETQAESEIAKPLGVVLKQMPLEDATNTTLNNTSICVNNTTSSLYSSKNSIRKESPIVRQMEPKTARLIISSIWKIYAPEKLEKVDQVLDKYKGRESKLVQAMMIKYRLNSTKLGELLKSVPQKKST